MGHDLGFVNIEEISGKIEISFRVMLNSRSNKRFDYLRDINNEFSNHVNDSLFVMNLEFLNH